MNKELSTKTEKLQNIIKQNKDISDIDINKLSSIYSDLIEVITEHNYLYYNKNTPIISDIEYDKLFDYLKKIEEYNPTIIVNYSPTQYLVGQSAKQESFQKAKHKYPLLSLENSYNTEDLIKRESRNQKILNKLNIKKHITYIIEPKFDGISVELIYIKGKLIQAITRGDGFTGEDITQNVKTIKNLPHTIKYQGELHLKGEIVLPKSKLIELNEEREKEGKDIFANTRNAAAGSIKLLDTNTVAQRGLMIYVYDILSEDQGINLEKENIPTFNLKNIKKEYSSIEEINKVCINPQTQSYLKKQDIEFDGLVIKIKDTSIRETLGHTAHHPRWAIAYKFPAQQVSTQIKSVEFQVGRTGIITPVANLKPVELSGATISRVSLHNFDFIKKKDIHYNDYIRIQRSGEVIPYIVGVIKNRRQDGSQAIKAPINCPSCKQKLTQKDIHFLCTNNKCPAIIKEKIIRFVSKDCMNIEGLGDNIISTLVEQNIIANIADIYKLLEFDTQRIVGRFPGFANKKIYEIQKSLNNSKQNKFWRLLNGLGIPGIGKKTAKDIYNELSKLQCKNLNQIQHYITDTEFLSQIHGLGDKTIQNIILFRKDNQNIIKELKQYGLNFNCSNENNDSNKGFFCITGSFDIPRTTLIKQMEENGYSYNNNITKDISFVFVGNKPGNKYQKAKELGIKIYQDIKNIYKDFPFIKAQKKQAPQAQSLF